MEYLVPVLAVVVIGALAFALTRWMSAARARRPDAPRTSAGEPLEIGPERARLAAALLDEQAHRTVYGHIAQSRVMEAVRDYRAHTGRSLMDAVRDVQSLAAHPQVYSVPAPEAEPGVAEDAAAGTAPADTGETDRDEAVAAPRPAADIPGGESPQRSEADASQESEGRGAEASGTGPRSDAPTARSTGEPTGLTVPADWTAAPAQEDLPFEVEVMRGADSVRLSSQDLSPWLRDQLSAMVRDGNLESAAVQLSSHSQLSVPEAYELLRRMRERRVED